MSCDFESINKTKIISVNTSGLYCKKDCMVE